MHPGPVPTRAAEVGPRLKSKKTVDEASSNYKRRFGFSNSQRSPVDDVCCN